MSKSRISAVYILIAGSLWGGIGIFFNMLSMVGLSQMQAVAVRVVTAALILGIIMLFKDRSLFKVKAKDLWCFAGTGLLSLTFFNWCYFTCIERTDLSTAAILLYTAPAFVAVMSAIIFKEKFTGKKSAALLLTFAGCIFVTGIMTSGVSNIDAAGIIFGVASGIGYALYSIFGRFAINRGYDSVTISFYTFLFAALGAVPLSGIFGKTEVLFSFDAFIGALGIGGLCCVVPFVLYTKGLERTDNGRASVLATVEPAVAAALSVAMLGESMGVYKALGILLIIEGVIIMNIREKDENEEILETGRLRLRKMSMKDFDELCKILKDEDVMYAYEHAFSDQEVKEWIQRNVDRYAKDGFGLWAVILKDTGELIGQCGITIQDWDGKKVPEIGYLFQKAFWHKGYALEAAEGCRKYAFDILGINEIFSIIRENNKPSINVALRNGMKKRGELIKHYYGMDMPHWVFSVRKEA